MWSRRAITVLLAFIAGIFDATISIWLPGEMTALRLALPFLIVLAAFSTLERAVTAAFVSGIVLDALLPSSAGVVTIRYILVALAISSLSQTLFTNRSLLGAQALGLLALALDRTLLFIFTFAVHRVAPGAIPEIRPSLWVEAVWIAVVMAAVFVLFVAFTRRFLPPLSRTLSGHGTSV